MSRSFTDTRTTMPIMWWYRKYGVTDVERNAIHEARDQLVRYRRWFIDNAREPRTGRNGYRGETWDEPSPDEVLLEHCDVEPGSRRNAQLLQIVCELGQREVSLTTPSKGWRRAG